MIGEELLPVRVKYEAIGLVRTTYYKKPTGLRQKDQSVIDALDLVALVIMGAEILVYVLPIYVTKVMPRTIGWCDRS